MKIYNLIYLLSSSMFLIGATWKSGTTLPTFTGVPSIEDEAVTISAKVYTAAESESVLKNDLLSRGYVPVEITIQNPTTHTYAISAASTAMSNAQPEEIAWKITKRSIPQGIALNIVSFFFWPFSILSTAHSIHGLKTHQAIVKMLTAKGLKQVDEIVLPYSMVKRILYIPENAFYRSFSVSMEETDSNELLVIPVCVPLID